MPHKFNTARRHKFDKAQYRVINWAEYNESLRQRGDLTIWVSEEAQRCVERAAPHVAGWPAEILGSGDRDMPEPAKEQTQRLHKKRRRYDRNLDRPTTPGRSPGGSRREPLIPLIGRVKIRVAILAGHGSNRTVPEPGVQLRLGSPVPRPASLVHGSLPDRPVARPPVSSTPARTVARVGCAPRARCRRRHHPLPGAHDGAGRHSRHR